MFKKLKLITTLSASILFATACNSQPTIVGETAKFPTVGFEETHKVNIPYSTEEVCPLFEPSGRHLIYKWWETTTLRKPQGDTLKGLMTVSGVSDHEIFLLVTQHEPEDGYMQYLVLWDDFELQRIDITCVEGRNKASTEVTWTERNAGLHERGVSIVSDFVEGGNLKAVVERYAEKAEKYIRNQK